MLESQAETTSQTTTPRKEKMRFLDVFSEEPKNETLTLKINIKINNQDFNAGDSFGKDEKIAGIDFHALRYLDLVVEERSTNLFEILGFIPKS